MKYIAFLRSFFVMGFCALLLVQGAQAQKVKEILSGSTLADGFEMGLDSSKQQRKWMTTESDNFKLEFPAGQKWAVMYITYGEPADEESAKSYIDLSGYKFLSVDLKGTAMTDKIWIGIKSNTQKDGKEKLLSYTLSKQWETKKIPLDGFLSSSLSDLRKIYVVFELVHKEQFAQTVYFKNVRYLEK